MTRGSVIRRGVVCLLLGVVTTGGVAWVFALVQPRPGFEVIGCWYRTADSWSKACLSEARHAGLVRRQTEWFTVHRPGRLMRMQEPPMRHEAWGLSDRERAQRLSGTGVFRTTEVAAGWPMPALWYVTEEGSLLPPGSPTPYPSSWPSYALQAPGSVATTPAVVVSGARLPDALGLDGRAAGEPVVLPLSPMWLGFAVDSAVFWAVWLGLATLWPVTLGRWLSRSRRRRVRGLCPACGYDLGGSFGGGCPECGWGKE